MVHVVGIVIAAEIVWGKMSMSSESLELKFFASDSFPLDIVPPAVLPLKDYVDGKNCRIR